MNKKLVMQLAFILKWMKKVSPILKNRSSIFLLLFANTHIVTLLPQSGIPRMSFKAIGNTKDDFKSTKCAGARYLKHLLSKWQKNC